MIAGILTSNVEKVLSLKFPLKHKYLREIRNFPLINTILKFFIWKPWLNTILIHLTSDVQTCQILMFSIWFYSFPAKAIKCFQNFMNKTWFAYYAPKLLSTLHQEDLFNVPIPLVSSITSIFHFGTGRGLRVDFNENFVGTWLPIWWSTLPLMRMTRTKTETKTWTNNSLLHYEYL